MTQEELNELILGKFDDGINTTNNKSIDENPFENDINNTTSNSYENDNHKIGASRNCSPPLPTNEHKVIYQLDDVTKGLEAKASQVFDQLESISQNSENVQDDLKIIKNHIKNQKKLFEKLSIQFPHIKAFRESLESSNDSLKRIIAVEEKTVDTTDCILQAMDIMQYQDIYRQKIERVVNVTRALSRYLSSIFDTDIEDDKRVSSAAHIEGDTTSDAINDDEIEKLISSLGKKQ